MCPKAQVMSVRKQIFSLVAIGHHYLTALFNNHFMRHPKNSVLADVLKTKQPHHNRERRDLKDADMETEAESANNKNQLLNKVIPLETLVIIDDGALLRQVLWYGKAFKKCNKRISQVCNVKI